MDSEKEDFEVEIEDDNNGFCNVVVIDVFDNNRRTIVTNSVPYEKALEIANTRRGMLKGTKSYARK